MGTIKSYHALLFKRTSSQGCGLGGLVPPCRAPWAVPRPALAFPGGAASYPWKVIPLAYRLHDNETSLTPSPHSDLFPTRTSLRQRKDRSPWLIPLHDERRRQQHHWQRSRPPPSPHSSSPPQLAQKDSEGIFFGGPRDEKIGSAMLYACICYAKITTLPNRAHLLSFSILSISK